MDFLRDSDAAIVALIEIKFASHLGDDISKLEKMAKKHDVLTWMIYGDHFVEGVHPSNLGKQQQRAEDMELWLAAGKRGMRGSTILRCGKIKRVPTSCGDALGAISKSGLYPDVALALRESVEFGPVGPDSTDVQASSRKVTRGAIRPLATLAGLSRAKRASGGFWGAA